MRDEERPPPALNDAEPMREAVAESKRRVERSRSMLQWLEDLLGGFGPEQKDKPKD